MKVNGGYAFHLLCAALTAFATASCGAPPQARQPDYLIVPQLELDRRWAFPGGPLELAYRFEVAPDNEAIAHDYEVFLDFVDAAGEVVFSDRHMPPVPTSTWSSGSVIEYPRTVFVPSDAPPGPVTVELSVRRPQLGQLIALAGGEGGAGSIRSRVGALDIEPPEAGLRISYGDGWYPVEEEPGASGPRWRWTSGRALSSFPNPRSSVAVYLHAEAHVASAEEPPEVSVRAGPGPGRIEVARFRVERPGPFLQRIYVPTKLIGGLDMVELLIEVDKVVVPKETGAGADERPLGLRVFNLHVEPRDDWMAYGLEPMNPIDGQPPEDFLRGEYEFTQDWFSGNIPVWEEVLAPLAGVPDIHYLEVGVFEGRSYLWMAENIFTHPSSTLTGVDLFTGFADVSGDSVKRTFLENVRRAGVSGRSTLYAGYSQLELRKLPFDSYDVIYVDGGHDVATVFEDAMLCRRLLRPGGIIIFDDYDWELDPGVRVATDMFVQIYGEEFSIVHRGYQLILRKGPRP